MMDFMLNELLKPVIRRAGTAIGVFMLAQGMSAEAVMQIETAFAALALFILDLVQSHRNRKG